MTGLIDAGIRRRTIMGMAPGELFALLWAR